MPAAKATGTAQRAGVRRGAAPSELAKGVQGETAAICRVPLYPFLYAAPRERAGVAKERAMRLTPKKDSHEGSP